MAALALAGCDDDDAIIDDMAVATQSDLAVGDLGSGEIDAGPHDLSMPADLTPRVFDLAWSMCAGTRLAGTCAEAFFEPFVACFQPSGQCGFVPHNTGTERCWQSGARYHEPGPLEAAPTWLYWGGQNRCLSETFYPSQPGLAQFCIAGDSACGSAYDDGFQLVPTGGARYNPQTGIFTCLDGTQVDIGPPPPQSRGVGDCPVLNELLNAWTLCDPEIIDSSCKAF